jgi:hypothetical protein
MNKLKNGAYDVTDKAALTAQRMGWSAAYLTALWIGNAITRARVRKSAKRGS